MQVGDTVQATPHDWGFGGEAIERRADGGWLVIAHAVPGERVLVEVVRAPRRPGGAWRARVIEVLAPSQDRVDPRCPHYSRCPGCHLRHVGYDVELGLKRRSVRDALERFAGIDPAVVEAVRGAPGRDGYRVRGTGSATTPDGRAALAAFPGSGPPVPLDECPVMAPGQADPDRPPADAGWTLPNPQMRALLTDTVAELLGLQGGEQVIEVGAGRGTLTVALAARSAAWVGLDVDPLALEIGRRAVREAGLSERAELRAGRVDKVARKLLIRHGRFDVALLNPMRRPLGRRAMAALTALGVGRCVYVGPSPTSTARDLRNMALPVLRVVPVDLFPGTYHVLTVALAQRVW